MVVRGIRAAALMALVLCLGSCGIIEFIFGSVFPSSTTLLQSRVDLSAKITNGGNYTLRVVEAGSRAWVVLTTDSNGMLPVYVMDLNLNLKKTLTGVIGGGVGVDGFSGDIVIGNQVLDPVNLALVSSLGTASYFPNGNGTDGFYSPNPPGANAADLSIAPDSSILNFSNFDASWGQTSTAPSGVTLSATMTRLYIAAVLEDDTKLADPVILAIKSVDGTTDSTTYFVSIHRDFFQVGSQAGAAGMLDSAVSGGLYRDNLLQNTIGFCGGQIIAWDTSKQSYVRLNPATLALTEPSFYAPADPKNMERLRYAYRVGGGSFYVYDPNARVITGYSTWW